jgi:DNA-binding response OmpR family regulator
MSGDREKAAMKADEDLRHIPVIMISAVDEIDSVIRCIELGAEDYLPKPFNPTLLRARVRACLERKRLHDQVTAHARSLRSTGATDGDFRGPSGHLKLARPAGASLRGHARERNAHL